MDNPTVESNFSNTVVLLDVDDTLIDLLSAWCSWLNRFYGLCVTPDEITDWNIAKFFPMLTVEQVFKPLQLEKFWKTVKPKDEAIKYVKQLVDDGFDVYICTSTDYRNVKLKFEHIIAKYFPFISWQQVIVTSRKQMIKADFLVDDAVHNHEGGDYFKILVSAPHNRGYDAEANGMVRSENWKSTYDIIVNQASRHIGGG